MSVAPPIAAERPRGLLDYPALLIRRLLRLRLNEASFQTRGFPPAGSSKQLILEKVGQTFIGGYNAAVAADKVADVVDYTAGIPPAERGFAVEGAAMGAAVVDALPFRHSLLPACIAVFKHDFTYLAHVGAGWALARVPWRRRHILAPLDPLHRWLAFDGLGFHDTYFSHHRILGGWRRRQLGYAARAYDQGVGRALWFVAGGSTTDAIDLILAFPASRQGDLWSGLGLATAYAGPVDRDEIAGALQFAGASAEHYAQGVAFACEARVLAGHVPAHTEMAAHIVAGRGAKLLSDLVREARDRLPDAADDGLPRYELWRRSVAAALELPKERRS